MKKSGRRRSRSRLKVALAVLVAAAVVGGAAFAAGLLPLSPSQGSAGAGSVPERPVPQSSLYWPQNSTAIIEGLCGQGSALFWVKQDNFTSTIQDVGQQMLTSCSITQTGGGVVASHQGLYLYQISVQQKGNATTTHTPKLKH